MRLLTLFTIIFTILASLIHDVQSIRLNVIATMSVLYSPPTSLISREGYFQWNNFAHKFINYVCMCVHVWADKDMLHVLQMELKSDELCKAMTLL